MSHCRGARSWVLHLPGSCNDLREYIKMTMAPQTELKITLEGCILCENCMTRRARFNA